MMSSITVPSSSSSTSSFLFSDPVKLGSGSVSVSISSSNSVRCCSFKRSDVPKLKPFSRTMFDRFVESIPVPLIEKTENDLSDYCTTLEGDECYSCWVACSELRELERTEPEKVVERIINQSHGTRSLIEDLHRITPILREKKNATPSAEPVKPSNVENKTRELEKPIVEKKTPKPERPFPVPDGLPRTQEELDEEERAKMPDSAYTVMLRRFGRFPAWYTPRPDHETD